MTTDIQSEKPQQDTKPQLPELPSDFQSLSLDTKIKLLLTNWIHRMDSLGELKDFVNRKAGWWVFDCPELQELVAQELELVRNSEKQYQRETSIGLWNTDVHPFDFFMEVYAEARKRWTRSDDFNEYMPELLKKRIKERYWQNTKGGENDKKSK